MRQEKQLLLDEIKEQINHYQSFVIIRYQGLKANAANALRNEVAKLGGNCEVMRKRVLIKAAENAGVTLDLKMLEGHVGLVFAGKDPIETTKLIYKFSKDTDNAISVIGGRFDGRIYSGADVETISTLPSKDEMRAQLLGTLEAPLAQTLSVMDAILTSLVYCLDNKIKLEDSAK
jgi:large subunit ribosomal protein L10